MGQIVSFHPKTDGLNHFYEVVGDDGRGVWGGENPAEAIQWWRRYNGARVLVSSWQADVEGEDLHPIGVPVDLTQLLRALLVEVVGK